MIANFFFSRRLSLTLGSDHSIEIPLMAISRVEKIGGGIQLESKDFRKVTLSFDASAEWVGGLYTALVRLAFSKDQRLSFAFSYSLGSIPFEQNGWNIFDPTRDYERVGLTEQNGFRLCSLNIDYSLCPSYPALFVVPLPVSDGSIKRISSFRAHGRVPVPIWRHPQSHATLSRSSQPLVGLSGRRCLEDEQYLNSLRAVSCSLCDRLSIFDARSFKAAVGNQLTGKGYENVTSYDFCDIHFLGIENIHSVRESLSKVMALIEARHTLQDDSAWQANVEATQWLKWIRLVLTSSVKIAMKLQKEGCNVLVHCSGLFLLVSSACLITFG